MIRELNRPHGCGAGGLVAGSLGTLPLPVVGSRMQPINGAIAWLPLCLELGAAAHVRAAHTDCRAQPADGIERT